MLFQCFLQIFCIAVTLSNLYALSLWTIAWYVTLNSFCNRLRSRFGELGQDLLLRNSFDFGRDSGVAIVLWGNSIDFARFRFLRFPCSMCLKRSSLTLRFGLFGVVMYTDCDLNRVDVLFL